LLGTAPSIPVQYTLRRQKCGSDQPEQAPPAAVHQSQQEAVPGVGRRAQEMVHVYFVVLGRGKPRINI
jgi:hypothetical protein